MIYSELLDIAVAYADRQDLEVNANMDVFIVLAEAKMNRLLKTRKQSARITTPTVTGQEYYSFPPDYAGLRDIQLSSGEDKSTPVSYMVPEQFNTQRNCPFGGKMYYTIIANQIQIFPKIDSGSEIELVYYQKVPPLNSTDDNNWMSLDNPDVYVAGVVAEIELFVKNYEVASSWSSRMASAINEIDNSDEIERWSGSQLITRLA